MTTEELLKMEEEIDRKFNENMTKFDENTFALYEELVQPVRIMEIEATAVGDAEREISRIKNTKWKNIVLIKAKANAAQGIPELIEIALNKRFKENLEEKHSGDAKYGWYRYDSRFALPVYDNNDEVVRYNIFKVVLVMRHAANGKLYLYDVIQIKKETGKPL